MIIVDTALQKRHDANDPVKVGLVGAGYIGLEMGSVYSRLGSRVVVLGMMDRILPEMDEGLSSTAWRAGSTTWRSSRGGRMPGRASDRRRRPAL